MYNSFEITQNIIMLFKRSPRPKFMGEIAEELNLEKSEVRYHIYAMVETGLLEKQGGNQQRPLYVLNPQLQIA